MLPLSEFIQKHTLQYSLFRVHGWQQLVILSLYNGSVPPLQPLSRPFGWLVSPIVTEEDLLQCILDQLSVMTLEIWMLLPQ